jgi:hypothetical protein
MPEQDLLVWEDQAGQPEQADQVVTQAKVELAAASPVVDRVVEDLAVSVATPEPEGMVANRGYLACQELMLARFYICQLSTRRQVVAGSQPAMNPV